MTLDRAPGPHAGGGVTASGAPGDGPSRAGDLLDPAGAAALVLERLDRREVVVVALRLDGAPARRRAVAVRAGERVLVRGGLGDPALDDAVAELELAVARETTRPGVHDVAGHRVFLERHAPDSELIIVGAGHIAQPLSTAASLAGFRVIVADDRPGFATRERFPHAHRVVPFDFDDPFGGLPVDEHTHVVLVTRGHKYDYECLLRLLRSPVQPGYIGMIGSRRRVRATWEQLVEEGIPRERIGGVRAPVGLDLGAQTPGEIALAVAAELVLERRGGSGAPLHTRERVLERFFPEGEVP